MRAWLISAFVLAGCLGNSAPPNNPAVERDPKAAVKKAWESYLKRGEYDKAAEIAFNNHLDPVHIDIALHYARLDAREKWGVYSNDKYAENSNELKAAMMTAYEKEVNIACHYGPSKSLSPALAVKDIQEVNSDISENGLLYLLLSYDCPLSHELRYEIIALAAGSDNDEFALWYALRSNFNSIDKMKFVKIYIDDAECSFGFKAALQLGVVPDDMDQLIRLSNCEKEKLDSKEWKFPSEMLRRYFSSAMRLRKYNLALELGRLSGEKQNSAWQVIQEAFNKHDEYALMVMIEPRPELRDMIFAYAIEHGRARMVGMQTKEIVWQQRAFDKLIEEGKYAEAAEVAEFGISETLKTSGILIAFKATMAKGNFEQGRQYFKVRYPKIITGDEYRKAADAWFEAHPGERRVPLPPEMEKKLKTLSKPRGPKCVPSKPGVWEVKRC